MCCVASKKEPVTLDTKADPEMLCTHEAHPFVPCGRHYSAIHPGSIPDNSKFSSNNAPLHAMFKDISINDRKESWKMRRSPTSSEGCDEELYVSGQVVIWSRGTAQGKSNVLRCFTADSPVLEALWCSFLIPVSFDFPVHNIHLPTENDSAEVTVDAQIQSSVCIVEAGCVNVYTHDGCNYSMALPFTVKKIWEMKFGLLFERKVLPEKAESSKTPKEDATKLPVLFSLTHPLEELTPVIYTSGNVPAAARVSFFSEPSQKIVYSSTELSLIMTYDSSLQSHCLWSVRRAKAEEADFACGFSLADSHLLGMMSGNDASHIATPVGFNQSGNGMSRLSMHSGQSPSMESLSPFRSYNSRISSPSLRGVVMANMGQPRNISPNINRLAVFSRPHSPQGASNSAFRLNTPSPQQRSAASSAAGLFSPAGGGGVAFEIDQFSSMADIAEPLMPEICLDHVWSELTSFPRDCSLCAASKVFHVADLSGQRYICYLVAYKQQLRYIRYEESNDKSQLIFGSPAIVTARDAIPLTTLQMILVLDAKFNLILYSGTMKMNMVHVPGLPSPAMLPPPLSDESLTELSFHRGDPITSSRPPSALDVINIDELRTLSPVGPEQSCRSYLRLLDSPTAVAELSFQRSSFSNLGCILSLSDPVDNRFTVEMTDNSLYRVIFPEMTCSPIIYSCLQALRWILPRDSALVLLTKWYCLRNAPGVCCGHSEWNQFLMCLLNLVGYDVNRHPLLSTTDCFGNERNSPTFQMKKRRLSGQGTDSDWDYLVKSSHHKFFCEMNGSTSGLSSLTDTFDPASESDSKMASLPIDTSAVLFPFLNYVLYALHVVYEDMRLDVVLQNQLADLANLLYFIAKDLGHELYADHYCRDVPRLFQMKDKLRAKLSPEQLSKIQTLNCFTAAPPNIYQWLHSFLQCQDCKPFPFIPGVNTRTEHVITMFGMMFESDSTLETFREKFLCRVSAVGRRVSDAEANIIRVPPAKTMPERIVLYITQLDQNLRSRLALGAVIPLKEAISYCQHNPPTDWPEAAYNLIGREDLAKQTRHSYDEKFSISNPVKKDFANQNKTTKEEDDGINSLDCELLKLRFSKDLRIKEVRKLLQSSLPVCINITQKPEISDHEFIEEQERYLFATSIRTMALPVGRGMLTLRTYSPVPTEALPIPKLCLTGRAPPRNATIEMTHIDVPVNMSHWPQFHNGVAAGLRISNNMQMESAWILLNKARSESLTNEHAGFLMGQGLNGHLSNLPTLSVHDYLIKGHEMTSMGLLLGISANKRGTMDVGITKLLSIHIAALLPPTSTELDVPHNVQVAAILGVGLVYQGTAQRHMAEVLLAEIGRPPGPEMENSADRESYSLAAGLALGFVMLGKGSEVLGLSDMGMPDQLYHYMVGGQKRPLTASYRDRYKSPSYQIKEGDCVNVDVTGPGATLALGLMFFNTNNSSVAEWFVAPDTQSLLDLVRPDLLMLRTLSRSLIMWQSIEPTHTWIRGNLPQIVAQYAFDRRKYSKDPDCDIDFETMSQAYCNIMAGGCMAVGLKYAGSCNSDVFSTLHDMALKILRLMSMSVLIEQAGKTTVESCLSVIIVCLALVMAGSGDLSVLRLCRVLRSRIGTPVTYGSHMAVGMACGLLFLGGGKYTLNTSPESVAAMLCAFYPRFPNHSNDNRYHLQAFRHLYVLAVEKRLVIPRDVATNKACYIELEIVYKDGRTIEVLAPYMLPELHLLSEVRVKGPRYWTVEFKVDSNWDRLKRLLKGNGYLYVKQRVGHLSFEKDPKGYESLLAQSLIREQTFGKVLKAAEIRSFTSDPFVLGFAEFFCTAEQSDQSHLSQMLSQVLYECVSHEKLEVLSTLTSLHHNLSRLEKSCRPIDLWQLKLIVAFYQRTKENFPRSHLISPEFFISCQSKVEANLASWLQSAGPVLASYFSGEDFPESRNEQCYNLLAAFLSWYSIPHPRALLQMGLQQVQTFPSLFNVLRPSGLSISSIMSLADAMKSAVNVTGQPPQAAL